MVARSNVGFLAEYRRKGRYDLHIQGAYSRPYKSCFLTKNSLFDVRKIYAKGGPASIPQGIAVAAMELMIVDHEKRGLELMDQPMAGLIAV